MTVPFLLPVANEATSPPERRGAARDGVRLLVTDRAARTHRDARFDALPAFLRRGDLLVANDSATIPAALVARRASGAAFALHLSTRIAEELWIAEPREPVEPGERVALADGGTATFLMPLDAEHPRLWYTGLALPLPADTFLARHGAPIRYKYVADAFPLADYQTVFARVPGSAEMPSAGRPFTARVLQALTRAGVRLATITLHAGVSSPERHERPYREWFEVPAATAEAVNATHRRGGRVVAAGTTVVRALETAVSDGDAVAASGWTGLIVTPERGVTVVDGLLTGFHEPEASHLDMLRAFGDAPLLGDAYDHAVERGYLWHEFGDVHLLI
ncbi:MAG TPA: S-adenosylmethionine:tRNA ribosyltransferase-isomerase [Candidatus Elarobacter sp.]